MAFDVSYLTFWLVLALILGGAVGWRNEAPGPQEPLLQGWFKNAAIAFAVGLVAAIIHLLSGRAAFWLETALLFYAAYVVGCLIGGYVKRTRAPA